MGRIMRERIVDGLPVGFLLAMALVGVVLTAPLGRGDTGGFGVLILAHGGDSRWNESVQSLVVPLRDRYPVEVAFGMGDAATIEAAVVRLEEAGARRIGVVRLFVAATSFDERIRKILGLEPGAPPRPEGAASVVVPTCSAAGEHACGDGYWRIRTQASFELNDEGLKDSQAMGSVLAARAARLSKDAPRECVLILAHGPGDDAENARWLASLDARSEVVRRAAPFHAVAAMTLREDWPDKRTAAETAIRAFVVRAHDKGLTTIVVPFRVSGFGPYAKVLEGLPYVADGEGLVPHPCVTEWISAQAEVCRQRIDERLRSGEEGESGKD